jgi:hypothetical protein
MEPAPTRNIADPTALTIWGSWSPYEAIVSRGDIGADKAPSA